jgi:3-phosphoshikimate 1-carboxyvinyltransferase
MLEKQIHPIPHLLNASVRVPGSKSLTNRALVIACLAKGITRITNALISDDSRYMVKALQALGFGIQMDETRCELTVTGLSGKIPEAKAQLFTGNAGTAMRFLCAMLTLGNGDYVLDGDERMRNRPIGGLVEALTQLGARVTAAKNACPPVKIVAAGLPGGKAQIAGDVSSQYLSAVLMVAPYARHTIELSLSTNLGSKPYVDLTLDIMRDFGVIVSRDGYHSFSIPTGCYLSKDPYIVESDASAASYFFAAPAICGGSVRVENISRRSRQGDLAFIDILQAMGCTITEHDNSITVTGPNELRGMDVDLGELPDTAQTLAVMAPFATSPTRIRGIASARVKETDRIRAMCTELGQLGVRVEEYEDGLTIHPCRKFNPTVIQTYHDHRMAMAFALIGLRVPGVTISDPGCVSKTFPNYFKVLESLSDRSASLTSTTASNHLSGRNKSLRVISTRPSTYRLGLVGYPLDYTLSPAIHTAALSAAGLHGDYSLFPIHPDELKGLKDLLGRVRSKEIHGLNVTIPHKLNVIPWLDEVTGMARSIGAVNTIFMRGGKLIGDNTDAAGFLADLNISFGKPVMDLHPSALILGAGGAARAVVYALTREGWEVTISARRIEQAEEIADGYENVGIMEMDSRTLQGRRFHLVVNTTPLGMTPQADQSPWPQGIPLPPHAMVYDLVYMPHETKLIKDARAQGLPAKNGIGMLVEQAVKTFEIWTGCKVPASALFESLKYKFDLMESS